MVVLKEGWIDIGFGCFWYIDLNIVLMILREECFVVVMLKDVLFV